MFAMAADDVRRARSSDRIEIDARKGSRFCVAVPGAAVLPKSEPSHQAVIDVTSRKLVVVMDKDILEAMGCCALGLRRRRRRDARSSLDGERGQAW
jgi:hypothetical protein